MAVPKLNLSLATIFINEILSKAIDEEIHKIIDQCYLATQALLNKHKKDLIKISTLLLEKEVIDGDDFLKLIGKATKELK